MDGITRSILEGHLCQRREKLSFPRGAQSLPPPPTQAAALGAELRGYQGWGGILWA